MRLLRPACFEIDLDAAAENLRAVRRLVGPERKIFAVVKADAYGFGVGRGRKRSRPRRWRRSTGSSRSTWPPLSAAVWRECTSSGARL